MEISRQIIFSFIFFVFLMMITGTAIADEVNVEFVSRFGGYVNDVVVTEDYAYLGQGQDLVILKISDAANPSVVGRVTTLSAAYSVAVAGNYAYVADGGNGLVIVDISNPSSPTIVGSYDTADYAYDVAVAGNYAYVADHENGLVILDISNPSSPTIAGSYDTANYARGVAVAGNYAYVADGGNGLVILDISNPSSPTLVGNYDTAGYAHDVTVAGNYVYVADDNKGLVILDISNPSSTTLIGSYDTADDARDVAVAGNYAYVADDNKGLVILDISNPSSPTLAGSYDTICYTKGVSIAGNYAYIADGLNGLVVMDISNPSSPTRVGNYDTAGYADGVAVAGNYAYVTDDNKNLVILDISNPLSPTLKGNYETDVYVFDVAVAGNYAYIAGELCGLVILDISNPSSPTLAGSCDTSGCARGIAVAGNYAYIADSDDGLAVMDISNPSSPRLIGNYDTADGACDVAVAGNYAYIADNNKGLVILDISNPSSPTLASNYDTDGNACDITVAGNYAYIADDDNGLVIVDISNPISPTLAGSYDTSGSAQVVAVAGNYVYVADGSNGLAILKTNLKNQKPTEGSLIQAEGSSDVYLIENGEKHLFTSPEALLWNGYSFDDITTITSKILQSYPDGEDIIISQPIIDKYHELGGAPIFGASAGEGEKDGDKDSAGTYCSYVNFENGSIEYFNNGDLAGKAYAIFNPFFNKWASMGYAKSVLGYPIDNMSDVQTSKFGTKFRYQNFANGTEQGSLEYNLSSDKVFEIHGAIFTKWSALGYADSELGLVTSDERDAVTSFKGTTGRVSDFENGHLHWHGSGEHYMTTYMTYGDLDKFYIKMGGTASDLGFPITDQQDGDKDSAGTYCSYVNFENGSIEHFENGEFAGKVCSVFNPFFNKWASMGYAKSVLGYPIDNMSEEKTSSKNTPYKYQLFTNGTQLGALEWNLNTNQVFEVHGAIFAKWAEIGFASSVLGLPTGDEQDIASSKYGTVGRYGTFENGHIHWNRATGLSFVTYGALNECYNKIQGTQSDLGFPIMSQVGTTDGHDYCEFEKGYIEWNASSGKYEPNYSPNINQRIDAKLKAKPNFPQYLLDPDYVGSVTVVSLEFADRVLDFFYSDNTDMREQYEKLYDDGRMYYGIRNSYLHNAKQSLKNNDITSAEEFLERADKMQKCSEMSFQAANEVFVGSTESAEIIAQGVRDECEFIADISIAYAGGSLSIIENADKYKDMMDATFTFIDLYKAKQTGGNDELAKQIFIKGLTHYIVSEIPFEELGGRTFEEATKAAPTDIDENAVSNYLLNEELTGNLITFSPEVHKVIMDLGVAEGLYLEDRFIDEGLNAMLEHMTYVSGNPYEMAIVASPVELRIYDSTGRVTGLVDGVVKNEIPNSIYESELETVFIYNATDIYRYETVGTANATYGLKIVHYENMTDQEIILTDVLVTINAKHIYNVDWENEAQVNKNVTTNKELVPPQSISNIQSSIEFNWINWTWTNPTDLDFNHTEIYLNNIFQTNTSAEYFNATGLEPETSYTLSTRTVDNSGNVNQTWVNSTGTTEKVPMLPVANFSSNVSKGYAPLSVQFTDLSENATGWNWDFDDGDTSTDPSPTHTYYTAGNYTVNLTVSNMYSINSKLATITVSDKPVSILPVANFSAKPTSGKAPLKVTFTDTSTGSPTSWFWNFGDGSKSFLQNPIHKYSKAGIYTVNLTVKNAKGKNTVTKTEYIKVITKPAANFSATPTSGKASLKVKFTDTSTGIPAKWFWNFGDGAKSFHQNPIHKYSKAGTYTVNLTVKNAKGKNTVTKTEYIKVITKPVANFTSSVTSGKTPLKVKFTDTSTGIPAKWVWDFGDGSKSYHQNPTHKYSKAGTYTVNLTVKNAKGKNTVTKTEYIKVTV